jgi:hypothetical protein
MHDARFCTLGAASVIYNFVGVTAPQVDKNRG